MTRPWKRISLLIVFFVLAGCTASNTEAPPIIAKGSIPAELEAVHYYVGKLPDRSYTETYGSAENPRPWYTAAEALGAMGKIAIPALIGRLDTTDPYELKLVLYALMLASQDPALLAGTDGDYLRLSTVLTQETNEENLRLARTWVQHYQHLLP